MGEGNWNIISLGGSMVMPGEVDVSFVKDFRQRILTHTKEGKKFLIIVGGGKVCRWYQSALEELVDDVSQAELDWMGISSTRLNADLVQRSFGTRAYGKLVSDPTVSYPNIEGYSVVVGYGWKPGWSTDYVATMFAEKLNASRIINLSNIDYVYTSDPKVDSDAVCIESATWEEYLTYIETEWRPGLSTPFDPIAAKKAKELGLRLSFVSASDLNNFDSAVLGKDFTGTVIV